MSSMNSETKKKAPTGTRKKILDVAGRLFAEKGYNNTSVRDIAAELGIANPSLYYHFKSKEEILKELMVEPLAVSQAAIAEAQQLQGESRLRRIIEGLLESLEVHSGIALMALRDGGGISEEQRDRQATVQPQIRELLAQDVDGENRTLRLTMAMGAVQAAVFELMHQSKTGDAFVEQLRAKRDVIIDLVINMVVLISV